MKHNRLIIKISNPESNQKEECADQYARILEDTLEGMHKMKGSKARSLNYATIDVDDFGVPSCSEGVKLDEDLYKFLESESSDSKYEKVRKLMNKRRKALTSKCMLNKSIEASSHKGFKIKWIENKKDKEGNETKEELENVGHKISCT